MKTAHLSIASVLVNALLLGAAFRLPSPMRSQVGPEAAEGSALSDRRVAIQTNWSRTEITLTNDAVPFYWSQVLSTNLEEYVANLRTIGCPQKTIRDLMEGVLTDLYLERRRQLMDPVQADYWNLNVGGQRAITTKLKKPLDQLREETVGRLDALVGAQPDRRAPERRHVEMAEFLPEDKRQAFVELNQQFDEKQRALNRDRVKDREKREEEIKDLQSQRDEAIQAILSAEELAEYKLRNSRYAGVAAGVAGLDLSEDEARALTRTYEQFPAGDKLGTSQREAAVKALLGEERFADYQRGGDGRFHEIYQVTERYELPRATAVRADDLRKAALEAARQIQLQAALSSEERLAALQQIQQETQAALGEVLGPRAAATYQENGGAWLLDLANPGK